MLKKILSVGAVTTILYSSVSFSSDGVVNFTGEILESACDVSVGGDNALSVNLGRIAKKSFATSGDTAAATKFTIKLTGCPEALTSVNVKFDGVTDSKNNNYLAITPGTGVASGVAIALYDVSQKPLPMLTASTAYKISTGDNNLDFYARYIATENTVNAGQANSTSTFSLVYN